MKAYTDNQKQCDKPTVLKDPRHNPPDGRQFGVLLISYLDNEEQKDERGVE